MVAALNNRTRPVKHSASADTVLHGKALQISIQKPNVAHKMSAITVVLINDL
jgi:hypothetical protein